jgi:hypothetical protein
MGVVLELTRAVPSFIRSGMRLVDPAPGLEDARASLVDPREPLEAAAMSDHTRRMTLHRLPSVAS